MISICKITLYCCVVTIVGETSLKSPTAFSFRRQVGLFIMILLVSNSAWNKISTLFDGWQLWLIWLANNMNVISLRFLVLLFILGVGAGERDRHRRYGSWIKFGWQQQILLSVGGIPSDRAILWQFSKLTASLSQTKRVI